MMKSRPRRRRYAAAESTPFAFSGSGCCVIERNSATSNRPAYRIPNDEITVATRVLQRLHGGRGSDLSERDRGARTQLGRLAPVKESTRIEDARQKSNACLTGQSAVTLEERHLLGERSISNRRRTNSGFDTWNRRAVAARREHPDCRDPNVCVLILEGASQRLHRARGADLRECGYRGNAHLSSAMRNRSGKRRNRRSGLHRAGAADRLESHDAIVGRYQTYKLCRMRSRHPRRGALEQRTELGVPASAEPSKYARHCLWMQLHQQLVEIVLRRSQRRCLEGLQQLLDCILLTEPVRECQQAVFLRVENVLRTTRCNLCLSNDVCCRPEMTER